MLTLGKPIYHPKDGATGTYDIAVLEIVNARSNCEPLESRLLNLDHLERRSRTKGWSWWRPVTLSTMQSKNSAWEDLRFESRRPLQVPRKKRIPRSLCKSCPTSCPIKMIFVPVVHCEWNTTCRLGYRMENVSRGSTVIGDRTKF